MTELVAVVAVVLAASFLCSVLEAVLLSVTHSHVALMTKQGHRAGPVLERMKRRIDEPIAVILTLNTIAHTFGATAAGAIATEVFGDVWIGVFSAVLTFAVLVFSEIIPKTLGATFWKRLAGPSAHTLRVLGIAMRPVIAPLGWLSRWIGPKHGAVTVSRAELAVLADIGRREGALDEDEFRVMSRVMRLDAITVGEVMTPRIDIVAVPADASLGDAVDAMLDGGKLRLPVHEGSLDRIVGLLLARDLWRAARGAEDGTATVREITRPMQFAPASKTVEDLIREMRAARTKMVVVLDEFGGTAGLVTLEDLIEEIVGEIQDEHESDEPQDFRAVPGGQMLVWGGTPAKDVEEQLGLRLGDEYDTIGGYVFGALDRIPRAGDEVSAGGGRLRVVNVRRRRIEYVLFTPDPQAGAPGDATPERPS